MAGIKGQVEDTVRRLLGAPYPQPAPCASVSAARTPWLCACRDLAPRSRACRAEGARLARGGSAWLRPLPDRTHPRECAGIGSLRRGMAGCGDVGPRSAKKPVAATDVWQDCRFGALAAGVPNGEVPRSSPAALHPRAIRAGDAGKRGRHPCQADRRHHGREGQGEVTLRSGLACGAPRGGRFCGEGHGGRVATPGHDVAAKTRSVGG